MCHTDNEVLDILKLQSIRSESIQSEFMVINNFDIVFLWKLSISLELENSAFYRGTGKMYLHEMGIQQAH